VPCVDIDDELYRRLQETAKRMGTTPETLLHTILEEWLTPYTPEEEQEVVKRLRELGYE
jgi:predicted transcriptional regulator